jgi:hypothetical protein
MILRNIRRGDKRKRGVGKRKFALVRLEVAAEFKRFNTEGTEERQRKIEERHRAELDVDR